MTDTQQAAAETEAAPQQAEDDAPHVHTIWLIGSHVRPGADVPRTYVGACECGFTETSTNRSWEPAPEHVALGAFDRDAQLEAADAAD